MIVIRLGSIDERFAVDAAGDRDHLQRVVHDGRPEPEAMPRLVEVRGQRVVHVEVAGGDRQVGGLERSAAFLVDDVEAADQPHVVDEVGVVAGPPAAVEVRHERRAADRAEHEVVAAEADVPCGIAGVKLEFGRGAARRAPGRDPGRVGRGASRRRCPRRRRGTGRSPGRRAPRRRSPRGSGATPDGSSRSRPRSGSRSGGTGCAASATEPGRRRPTRVAVAAVPAPRSSVPPRSPGAARYRAGPARTNGCRLHRHISGEPAVAEPDSGRCRRPNGRFARVAVRMCRRHRHKPAVPSALGFRYGQRPRRADLRPGCPGCRVAADTRAAPRVAPCAVPAGDWRAVARGAPGPCGRRSRAGSGVRPRTTSGLRGSGGRARCSTRAAGRPGHAGGAAARSTMRARPPNPGRRATRVARRSSGRARMARSAG